MPERKRGERRKELETERDMTIYNTVRANNGNNNCCVLFWLEQQKPKSPPMAVKL